MGPEPTALVFPAPQGGYLSCVHFRQRVWLPALKITGLSYRFHDLRHSALTWAAASGATIAELMHRAGHSTPAAALRYQHATEERDEAVARGMAELAEPASIVPLRQSTSGTNRNTVRRVKRGSQAVGEDIHEERHPKGGDPTVVVR